MENNTGTSLTVGAFSPGWAGAKVCGDVEPGETLHVPMDLAYALQLAFKVSDNENEADWAEASQGDHDERPSERAGSLGASAAAEPDLPTAPRAHVHSLCQGWVNADWPNPTDHVRVAVASKYPRAQAVSCTPQADAGERADTAYVSATVLKRERFTV